MRQLTTQWDTTPNGNIQWDLAQAHTFLSIALNLTPFVPTDINPQAVEDVRGHARHHLDLLDRALTA